MKELIDGFELTFGRFVEQIYPVASQQQDSNSFINPERKFRTMLISTRTSKLSLNEKEFVHSYDESYLLPIADELGINPIKALKIIALRNAWISYFQRSSFSEVLLSGTAELMQSEISKDYILLTSKNWVKHLWIQKQIHAPESCPWVSVAEQCYHAEWEAGMSSEKDNIFYAIGDFRSHMKSYSNDIEKNADLAKNDIKRAKNTIQELRDEIKKQDAIIELATRPIAKYQYRAKLSKKNPPGKPKVSDNKELQERHEIAKKFVARWTSSLMDILEIESCDKLAKFIAGSKMTWWRWLNQETLPTSKSLRPLLNVKIKKTGDFQGKKLREIQTSPSLLDLVTLIELV